MQSSLKMYCFPKHMEFDLQLNLNKEIEMQASVKASNHENQHFFANGCSLGMLLLSSCHWKGKRCVSICPRSVKPTRTPVHTHFNIKPCACIPDTLSYTKLSLMCISSIKMTTHFSCSGHAESFLLQLVKCQHH